MKHGARTPEELERLLEDAFVVRDAGALPPLFEERAVLLSSGLRGEARGSAAIARSASSLWERDHTYVADPRHVLQAGDVALVLTSQGINVARRGGDGAWRYAISLLDIGNTTKEDQ